MLEQLSKFKRQIEILGLCPGKKGPSIVELADMFGCEELTIKRDLKELRAAGIDIHSSRGRGVQVSTQPDNKRLQEYIMQYLGMTVSDKMVDKATAAMVRRLRNRALTLVVTLQRCVEDSRMVVIDYEKEAGETERNRAICPLMLFQSEGLWRVLAVNDGIIKQYHLNKIQDARATAKTFAPPTSEERDAMFRHSFRSWIGTETHRVRIRLSATWVKRLKPHLLFESQIVGEERDGGVIFETTVNSLDEIATWVVSRGEGVAVISPEALRDKVIAIAEGSLRNYRG